MLRNDGPSLRAEFLGQVVVAVDEERLAVDRHRLIGDDDLAALRRAFRRLLGAASAAQAMSRQARHKIVIRMALHRCDGSERGGDTIVKTATASKCL